MGILDKPHSDWPWPFSYIPRDWNAVPSQVKPVAIAHSNGLDKVDDIPNRGNWALTKVPSKPWYGLNFALTTESGWHLRIGTFRYDFVDGYYTFPTLTVKKLESV